MDFAKSLRLLWLSSCNCYFTLKYGMPRYDFPSKVINLKWFPGNLWTGEYCFLDGS